MDDDGTAVLNEPVTFFHLPGEPPYEPLRGSASSDPHDIRAKGYVPLGEGSEVSIHGMGRYRVTRIAFHVGHDDELPGLHLFLEEIEGL